MIDKLDYKKAYKELYMPKTLPVLVDVPKMNFIMVDGKGNPNEEGGEYQYAVELLYGLSYAVKMSKLNKSSLEGYFDYVVPPLEGLWWLNDQGADFSHKEKYCWISMIRQPEFVINEVFERACIEIRKKKPYLNVLKARLETYTEGLCVQMMHAGPYENESETIARIENYIKDNNLKKSISDVLKNETARRHHEIYLTDPRKTDPKKLKTVLRYPVERKQ